MGELVNLRGPEKAKQNRLLCFYLGKIRSGSRMQQRAVIWRHQIRLYVLRLHTAAAHRSHRRLMPAAVAQQQTGAAGLVALKDQKVMMRFYITKNKAHIIY